MQKKGRNEGPISWVQSKSKVAYSGLWFGGGAASGCVSQACGTSRSTTTLLRQISPRNHFRFPSFRSLFLSYLLLSVFVLEFWPQFRKIRLGIKRIAMALVRARGTWTLFIPFLFLSGLLELLQIASSYGKSLENGSIKFSHIVTFALQTCRLDKQNNTISRYNNSRN